MAKVITFSRHFPKYHPKAGQPTYFVEMIYKSLFIMKCIPSGLANDFNFAVMHDDNYMAKHHTIRSGSRFKKGDFFSPRVWSGIPYRSPQIIINEDTKIANVWDLDIFPNNEIHINGVHFATFGSENCSLIATNDGLKMKDFINWFPKLPFKGQIICWNSSVEYS